MDLFARSAGRCILQTKMIKLGDKVSHIYSGFTGRVVAKTEWINGCFRFTVQPKATKDGVLPEANSFDEMELKLIETNKHKRQTETGGPRPTLKLKY